MINRSLHTRRSRHPQTWVAMLFLMLASCLLLFAVYYWMNVLEPQLDADARSNATALASSESLNLMSAIKPVNGKINGSMLSQAIDEILIVKEPNTGSPFILGLSIELDYDVVLAPRGSLDFHKGQKSCEICFNISSPLYDRDSGELLGIVHFRSSAIFVKTLKENVRTKLLSGIVIFLVILAFVWKAVSNLLYRLQQSEQATISAKEEAESATQAKSQFLATMSHEIRTPMNAVQGAVELLRRKKLPDEQYKLIETISYSNKILLRILDDILDLSKIEDGKMIINRVDFELSVVLEQLVTSMGSNAINKGLKLTCMADDNLPKIIHGDPVRFQQIFWNLLSNAIKFTESGEVKIQAREIESVNRLSLLEFAVIDSGVGIPQEKLAVIFDPFIQVDSSISRSQSGTGLGLAICKQIVDLMGGVIEVDSHLGQGSTFRIVLPFQVVTEAIEKKSVQVFEEDQHQSILLVDDESISLMIVESLLSDEGYKVTSASSGAEALEKLDNHKFDVILMDLRMPNMDGFETAKRIRMLSDKKVATLKIVAFTGDVMQETVKRCLESGMDAVVAKPIDVAEINKVLTSLSSKHASK
jgi:signal transduction histidine kinase/ActR/RegA family two-component response regulator